MFADRTRTEAYLAAIHAAVKPGSVVVEIGTGVGFFAVAACRAGARRVHAIEMNPAVELGASVAADNGCADRITFHRDDSRRVNLSERADVLLSDLRGVLPLHGEHIATLVDARARLVHAGAAILPRGDSMWAAPCVAPSSWWHDHVALGDAPYGIDRRAVAARVRGNWYRCRLDPPDLLAEGVEWATLDYTSIESPHVSGRAGWTVPQAGVAEGVVVWFDADLGFGATFSNAPGAPRSVYGQAFFPFERALALREGDRLAVQFRASFVPDEYVWEWSTTLTPASAESAPIRFVQSSLAAGILSLDRLRELGAAAREAVT